jgi:hypothetical protein
MSFWSKFIRYEFLNDTSEELEELKGEPEWFQAAVNSFLVLSGIAKIIYSIFNFIFRDCFHHVLVVDSLANE